MDAVGRTVPAAAAWGPANEDMDAELLQRPELQRRID